MRKLRLLALSFSALSAAAVPLDVARMTAPSYADREASGDIALLPTSRMVCKGLRQAPVPVGGVSSSTHTWTTNISAALAV